MSKKSAILILSEDLDYHGAAVMWGLTQMGVIADWWDRSEFPSTQLGSISLSNRSKTNITLSNSPVSLTKNKYRTIWNRRGATPTVRKTLNASDKIAARNESVQFLRGAINILSTENPDAMIVNGFEQAASANYKVYQLHLAASLGFNIPNTLVSNDPEEIRRFFSENNSKVVAKMHFPFAWRAKDGTLHITGTSALNSHHLAEDNSLQDCPMIYQEMIEITNEFRVIIFGQSIFAINQILPEHSEGSFHDVRYQKTTAEPVILDNSLAEKCLSYMSQLGLTYAAFDIAQAKDGRHIFLEANESGQFLFLEDICPELKILDAFCQFLISGDKNFQYAFSSEITLALFENSDFAKSFHQRNTEKMNASTASSPFELQD